MKKRILHVSKYYYPFRGGTEVVCQDIAEGLMGEYENKIICFNHEKGDKTDWVNGIEVIRCGCFCKVASQSLSFSYYSNLKRVIREWKPDAIHFHHPNPFVTALLLNLVPRDVKLVVHWHLDIFKQRFLYACLKWQERRLLERADAVIVTSTKYRDGSLPLKPYLNKVSVINNGINTDRLQMREGDEQRIAALQEKYGNRPIIFFVGRHVPYKGLDNLVEAEKYIHSDCVIVIAGEGPLTRELKSKANSDRVIFVGNLSEDDLRIHLYASQIFAFPSITKNEAFGLALAEAMYCGCVPVTFTIPGSGVNVVSVHDITGIEVENRNIKLYAEAIDRLLSDEALRLKYASHARQRVEEHFTVAQEQKSALLFYRKLLEA